MLVLKRNAGERILLTGKHNEEIGDIWIKITKIEKSSVSVGIEASDNVLVLREELVENKVIK